MPVTAVGVPGQPATNLTAWQKSVRDVLNSSDVTVDARIAAADAGQKSVWSADVGWADFGSSYGGLLVTRSGPLVTVEGMLKRTGANLTVNTSTEYSIGTVPVGYRPTHIFQDGLLMQLSTVTQGTPGRVAVNTNGAVTFVPMTAGTINNGQWILVASTYRGA